MARQLNISDLKKTFSYLYPDYKTKSYFLPPVIINKVPFERETVCNQSILRTKLPGAPSAAGRKNTSLNVKSDSLRNHLNIISPGFQHSDLREDLALQLVKSRLHNLAAVQNDVMFVLSQLQFSDYLSKSCYANAIEMLPRKLEKSENKRGDFDLLLFHREYGILIGEIKSVGSPHIQDNSQTTAKDIRDRVKKAIKQLEKEENVIREWTKDLRTSLRLVKTVILPYIWRTDLQRVITDDDKLRENLVRCLNAKDDIHALDLCLLADNLSDRNGPWETHQIKTWWEKCVSRKKDPAMTDDVYLDIVARFCGRATSIRLHCVNSPRLEVRTEGEGVSVVGERMAQLILTPEQIQLLCEMPRNVFLCGPPGTGKSVLLALMALKRLEDGDDVYIVSTVSVSVAASMALKVMLEKALTNTSKQHGDIHFKRVSLDQSDDEANKLIAIIEEIAKSKKNVFAIVDEAWTVNECQIARYFRCTSECCKHANINLWAAGLRHDIVPEGLRVIPMTIPLRSPPKVLREVEKSFSWYTEEKVHAYKTQCIPEPCDGPDVIHVQHCGHVERWPTNCPECGKAVAKVLKDLGIGKDTGNLNISTGEADSDIIKLPALTYGDVFVLTGFTDLQSCGFVTGLHQAGIKEVRVLMPESKATEVEEWSLTRNNEVTVASYMTVIGLERKVVVYLPHPRDKDDDKHNDDEIEAYGRNHAMSRCTSLLIVVDASFSD